jgi:protein-S-isoprenylcysteine O-methyltransferase Ste14
MVDGFENAPMTQLQRFLPFAGILTVFLIGVLGRALLQRTRFGTWGIVRSGLNEPAQAARAAGFAFVFILLGVQAARAAFHSMGGRLDAWLTPAVALIVSIIGTIVLAGGLVLLAAAQWQMGASWRIGIDENAKPGLVVSGLFRLSRNPVYLALLMIIAGYAVLLPTLWSLVLWLAAYLLVRLQIAAEESYLRLSYGEAYEAYARRVSRLIPCFGLP